MLFSYPIAAAEENWIHECLIAVVTAVHGCVDAGRKLPKWPAVIPEAFREKLKARDGLKSRLKEYNKTIRALSPEERAIVLDAMASQNRLPELLRADVNCPCLVDLPATVRAPIRALFDYAFELLSEFEVRQRQYQSVWTGMPAKMCPFCGCEYFDAPGAPQEDLDHYLPRSKYPFAAANLRNLPPMGGKCNSAYKRAQDPLRHADGARRKAFDPYAAPVLQVSLDQSVVDQDGLNSPVEQWVIDFNPACEEVETWDTMFHIRERFKRDVLDVHSFSDWLNDFKAHCGMAGVRIRGDADMLAEIDRYYQYILTYGFRDRCFLKAAFFKLLRDRCTAGCQRLLPIVRDVAGLTQPLAVE